MSFGSTEMSAALKVSAITDLLDTYASNPAIFDDVVIPQTFTGKKSINFYLTSQYSSEAEIYDYTINCRAATMGESRTIASTVIDTISRENGSNYYIYCEVLGTISPADSLDNFNTPLTATIKLK
ncbi:hypothetical protein [Pseudoalteromonas sp.]|uniref:hypothetical protein n=1 Tax=Pseudoalteromonas sp. TaxID=53249 RepID=UPI002612EB7B|nr:hypothetical protein [Pseudoalteromonas sp.]MCP4585640.1 hypothetical protein [Pseudoalteromonas sp.]